MELLVGNTGSGSVVSSPSPAPLCETSLCLPGSAADEDGRRTTSNDMVWAEAGAELPAALDAARVSDTGIMVLSPLLVVISNLGVLVRGALGRCPPEVPSGEALSEAAGEPMSNESMDDTVASLLLPPWAPKEEWVLSGDLVVAVLVV